MSHEQTALMKLLRTAFDLHQRRELEQARRLYAAVLERDPHHFDAIQLLGLCTYQMGRAGAALEFLNRALAIRQDVASVFNHRGIVFRSLGKLELALADFTRALELNGKLADAAYNRANTLRELGRLQDALADYRTATALNPSRFEYLNNLGGCLQELKRHEEALECFDRLLASGARVADVHYNRGVAQQGLGWHVEAIASFDNCIGLNPAHAAAHTDKGYCLKELSRVDEARASYEASLAIQPDNVKAQLGLAQIASETGDFADAEARFARVLSADPINTEALFGISRVKKFAPDDPVATLIASRLADRTLDVKARAQLHHALAKIRNDAGSYDEAFEHFELSKSFEKATFDLDRHSAFFAGMKALFTRQFFADRRDFGTGDERLVFIVGMPRSGTTLTEQILASHGLVEGLGELADMFRIMDEFGSGARNVEQFARAVSGWQPSDVVRLAGRYREAYARAETGAYRIIDKRPHNFEYLGVIALMFPKARIIHCRRNPMDNCLSMYMQDFNKTHGYNRDLATLGRYYRAYEDLMGHWQAVLPIPIYDCVYEETVRDVETSARSLVAFLGLEWDSKCLNYAQLDRQVRTPSLWQVRQPIYDESVGRWRRYEKHLGPLKEGLGPAD